MKIKVVVGVVSLLGMQYVVAADIDVGVVARRLELHSQTYRDMKAGCWVPKDPVECYKGFIEALKKIDVQINGITIVLNDAQDDSEQALLEAYTKCTNVIDAHDKKRMVITELLNSADFLCISALRDACADDLAVALQQQFPIDPKSIVQEADRLSVLQQRLMIEKILQSHRNELERPRQKQRLEGYEGFDKGKIVYSPNGLYLASLYRPSFVMMDDNHSIIKIWDVASGKLMQEFDCDARVYSIAYSQDGSQLALSSYGAVTIWDVVSGKLVHRFEVQNGNRVRSVIHSPDGSWLAAVSRGSMAPSGRDPNMIVWNIANGEQVNRLANYRGDLTGGIFSPDSSQLALGSYGPVIIWDMKSGEQVYELGSYYDGTGAVFSVAFSPNCLQLASGHFDETVAIWDMASGKLVHRLAGHKGAVKSVAYSPDGLQLAACTDDGVIIWDTASGEQINGLVSFSHKGYMGDCCVAYSPDPGDSQLAVGFHGDPVTIWSISSFEKIVYSVNIPQALYICHRLAELRNSSLEEASSQEIKEDYQAESFSTRVSNHAAALTLSFLGMNQLEGAVKLLSKEKEITQEMQLEEARESYLAQLYNSLPEKIKELLGKKL